MDDKMDEMDKIIQKADIKRCVEQGKKEIDQADGVRMAKNQFSTDVQQIFLAAGQAQAANVIMNFSRCTEISRLAKLKGNKEYRKLKGIIFPDGTEFLGTWADFCDKLVGRSSKVVDEDIINLNMFGETFMELARRLKLGYRDFREMRKLPDEDRLILIEGEIIDSGDREAVRELIEDLHEQRAKEINAYASREETMQTTLDAINKVSEIKNKQLQDLAVENERLKGSLEGVEESPVVVNIRKRGGEAEAVLILLRGMANRLNQEGGSADPNEVAALTGVLDVIRTELALAYRLLEAADPAYQACNELASVDAWNPDSGVAN